MKILFIADIHGSLYYTKKGLEAYREEQADYIVLLGDVLYHGARNPLPYEYNPKEVIQILNEYATKIIAVKGNCDSEVDEMVLDFPLTTYSSILYNKRRIFITHGHNFNEDKLPKLSERDILIYGHTHINKITKKK